MLQKALTLHHDQTARSVWFYPQFDKYACAWLTTTPSPATFILSPLFREAMTAHLCLPSSSCQGQLDKPTGYKDRQGNPTYVDIFGDQVMYATLCHDTWRVGHNDIKIAIVAEGHEARLEKQAEPFVLLKNIIPAAAMGARGEMEIVRGRSGCVPDLRLGFPVFLQARPPNYHPPRSRPGRQAGACPPGRPAPPATPRPRAK